MPDFILEIELLGDTTFGRGDGLAAEVDAEVQHDEYGFPYLAGRTLKGLLVQECADILAALPKKAPWERAARYLFGQPGSGMQDGGHLIVGDAQLPASLRAAVAQDVSKGVLTRQDVLESLTALRWQTAIDPDTGAPRPHTLRSARVILRGTRFRAELYFDDSPVEDDLKQRARLLLTACAASLRRVGTGRNRGRGLVRTRLLDDQGEEQSLDAFFQEVRP